MKRFKPLFLIAIILILAISVMAQEDEEEERWRTFEVTVNGGLTGPLGEFADWKDSLDPSMGFNMGLAGGYYFNDNFCAGLYFKYSQNSISGDLGDIYDMKFRMFNAGTYFKYVVTNETSFEPYTKLSIGINTVKFPTWVTPSANILREQSYDPGLSTSLTAGLLFYTSDMGGVFIEGSFYYDMLKDKTATYSGNDLGFIADNVTYFEIKVGVNVFFGPDE